MKVAIIGIVGGGGAAATLAGISDANIPMGIVGIVALLTAHSIFRGVRGRR
jgi:hypothetical protein